MSCSHVRIQVQQGDFANHAATLKSEPCAGSYQTATTDNANLHWIHSLQVVSVLCFRLLIGCARNHKRSTLLGMQLLGKLFHDLSRNQFDQLFLIDPGKAL